MQEESRLRVTRPDGTLFYRRLVDKNEVVCIGQLVVEYGQIVLYCTTILDEASGERRAGIVQPMAPWIGDLNFSCSPIENEAETTGD